MVVHTKWTLMLLKPDIVSHPVLLKSVVTDIFAAGIEVSGANYFRMTPEIAHKLYGVHEGKFFYPRLVRHVCSGPVIAMKVRGDVRTALGSSRLWPLPVSDSSVIVDCSENSDADCLTIRQRFSLSDVRNVAHTSDAEVADQELSIFEPFTESVQSLLEKLLPSSESRSASHVSGEVPGMSMR